MTFTQELLDYIKECPYSRIEDLEDYFSEKTKSQLQTTLSRLNKQERIEWTTNPNDWQSTQNLACSFNSGWIIKND